MSALADVLVGVVMGSESDWPVMKCAVRILEAAHIPHEAKVVSAHRTPDWLYEYAKGAKGRLDIIIAGAGGAAHLPGMLAALTLVPVLGVPIAATSLHGMDALISIVQMPKGTPVAIFGIGEVGATNAAYFAMQMLSSRFPTLAEVMGAIRLKQADHIINKTVLSLD